MIVALPLAHTKNMIGINPINITTVEPLSVDSSGIELCRIECLNRVGHVVRGSFDEVMFQLNGGVKPACVI